MSNIISVSITDDQKRFLDETETSPSKLLQAKIDELIDSFRVSANIVKDRDRRITFLQATLDKQRDFIMAQGLMDKFVENV